MEKAGERYVYGMCFAAVAKNRVKIAMKAAPKACRYRRDYKLGTVSLHRTDLNLPEREDGVASLVPSEAPGLLDP